MTQKKESKRPRRSRRIFKRVVLLSIIAGGAVYYWINSPTFAVMQLEKAIKDKDLATFYSRLDLDRLYDSSIDALTVIKSEGAPESPWDSVQKKIGAGVTKVLKSQVMDAVKHEIELEFRKSEGERVAAPFPSASPLQEFFGEISTLDFARPVRSGEKALVNVSVHLEKMKKTYPVTLRLEKLGDWKLTGFEGLASTLTRYKNDQALIVAEHNRLVQKEMAEVLPFFGQVRQEDNRLGLGKEIHFEFLFQNKGASVLNQIDGTLVVLNVKNDEILREPLHKSELNLGKLEKKVFLVAKDIGIFTSKTASTETLTLQFKYEQIRFKDGKNLVTVKTYQDL